MENVSSCIVAARVVDTGCYVDSHMGQYAGAQAIMVARAEFAYPNADAVILANRKLLEMGPRPSDAIYPEWTYTDEEALSEAVDDCEEWLNSVTQDGFSWMWLDGDFCLCDLRDEGRWLP